MVVREPRLGAFVQLLAGVLRDVFFQGRGVYPDGYLSFGMSLVVFHDWIDNGTLERNAFEKSYKVWGNIYLPLATVGWKLQRAPSPTRAE